jgi:hypothetical protein
MQKGVIMSHATMLEHVKAELDNVEAEALQSIQEIIDKAKRKSAAMPEPAVGSSPSRAKKTTAASQPLKFIGENLTLEEFERLSLEERAMVKWRLKEQNHAWLQEKFSVLDAAWVVVVDGQVIASGRSLDDKPRQPQNLEICKRTGKFPLVFVNDKFITIEEGISLWHETKQAGDYYPTLPVTLRSAFGVVEVAGDFDTGLLTLSSIMIFSQLKISFNLKQRKIRKGISISINRLFTLISWCGLKYLQIQAKRAR